MTQPRLALRSGPRAPSSSRAASSSRARRRCLIAGAIESLESRRLMCSDHGDALSEALAQASARTRDAVRTDHKAAWYAPAGAVRLDGATAVKVATVGPAVAARAGGDDLPGSNLPDSNLPGAAPTFDVNAAGLPLLTSRANGEGLEVFLDFDGYGTDQPFSTDDDLDAFNGSEQVNIYETWRDIVSYFAPLDVNVTTVQPATGGDNPAFIWHRISNSITGGAAYVGWFTNERSNSWTGQDGGTTRHSGIAHEIGHQLGLYHQAEYDGVGNETTDYSDGFGPRDRPIIGIDYAQNVRSWWYGRNGENAANLQNDLGVMSSRVRDEVGSGDGYLPDDFAAALTAAALTAAATAVPAGGLIGGIIERAADLDVFRLSVGAPGTYHIDATPTFESALSPRLELLDAAGNVVAARDDADQRDFNNNDQEFSLNLAAGTYYVCVASSGDYGEIGEYLLTAAPLAMAGLPVGWTSYDVGFGGISRGGTAAYDPAAGLLTQLGGGTDIWGTGDQFRFTATTLTGDGSITARIDALDDTSFNAKAGVMIRASAAANSAMVFVGVKPSGLIDPIVRTASNASAAALGNPSGTNTPWVRITRAGNTFTIARSVDGVAWTTYGTTTVGMGAGVQIGFATNSQSPRRAAYATFGGIDVTGALGTPVPTYNALPAPTDLAAAPAPGANTSLNVTWAGVAGAAGYAIERSADGVTFAPRTTVGAGVTSYLDAGLFGSMRYFYRVAAIGTGSTRSAPSAAASAVNKPNAPAAPMSSYAPSVIRLSVNRLLLNWFDVQGDNGYRVERAAAGGAFATITTTPKNFNAYNDNAVAAGVTYTYRITPLTSVGDGAAPAWTLSAATPLGAAPGFRVSARSTTSMTLAWSDLSGETGYHLERSTDGQTWTALADLPANATAYAGSTGLAPLTRYYYRLRALDSGGLYGVAANAMAATLAATPPPAGWSGVDVGAVPGAGASAGSVGGNWTVIGSGNDIWNQVDQFHYLARAASGDGTIVARLADFADTSFFVKNGLMFRASDAANAAYAFMHYSSGPGLQFEYRDAFGGLSSNAFSLTSDARWLKLARVGDTFTGSYSVDGLNWTVAAARTITMPAAAKVGFAATSHNVARLTRATYDNVSTNGFAPANAAPAIVAPAAANPAPVTGTTADLTVGAADDGGAANLTYVWSAVSKPAGVADPTFATNDANAASATTATFAAAGNYVLRATVRDAQGLTATSDVSVAVALRALESTFDVDALRPNVGVRFNADVGASLGAADLTLTNLTTGQVVPAAAVNATFAVGVNAATFTFSLNGSVALPDGDYRATFAAGSLIEPSGVALADEASFDFFVLAGDADRDRDVDFTDLVTLAQNYGRSDLRFAAGNFDYDLAGNVDFADLVILAQRYGTTLAPQAAAAAARTFATPSPVAPRSGREPRARVADDVL